VVGLKFKANNQNILEFDFIIIIAILAQIVNFFQKFGKIKII
jgi:hypothetical protein